MWCISFNRMQFISDSNLQFFSRIESGINGSSCCLWKLFWKFIFFNCILSKPLSRCEKFTKIVYERQTQESKKFEELIFHCSYDEQMSLDKFTTFYLTKCNAMLHSGNKQTKKVFSYFIVLRILCAHCSHVLTSFRTVFATLCRNGEEKKHRFNVLHGIESSIFIKRFSLLMYGKMVLTTILGFCFLCIHSQLLSLNMHRARLIIAWLRLHLMYM